MVKMVKITKENLRTNYWYKEDLQKFCREKRLPSYGTKAELLLYIEKYFNKVPLKKITPMRTQKKNGTLKWYEMSVNTKLLNTGFALNNEARKFFQYYFGVEKFSFRKNMAVKLREVETFNDSNATIQDLIDAYLDLTQIKNSEEKTYEWNHFVRDFFSDSHSKQFCSKMKVASILWDEIKQSNGEKTYNSDLINKYQDKIQAYNKGKTTDDIPDLEEKK